MSLPRILYWSHAPASVYDVLRRCADGIAQVDTLDADSDAERTARIADADAVIVAARPLAVGDVAVARRLKLVHHQGVGWQDTVPAAALADRGIRLALTPEGTTTGVAEHTVLLMLAVCKRLAHVDSELRQGRWHINTYRSESRELSGMTIGYIGFGRIGQAVAARLRAFDTRAVFHDPAFGDGQVPGVIAEHMRLPELLACADIVSMHLPYTAASRHILGAVQLAQMKRGAIVVNAARGGLVDEQALHASLVSGHLAGAGLDCFEREPPSRDHPLFALHNVVVTPHSAAATVDALVTKMNALFANIDRWRRGEPLHHEVALTSAAPGS